MENLITINDPEYFDAQAILYDIKEDKDSHTEEEYQEAKSIVDEANYLHQEERESHYVTPHYPDAPEGSIWDY